MERVARRDDKLNLNWFQVNHLNLLWSFDINYNFAFGIRQNHMVSQHSRLVWLAEIMCRSRSGDRVSISWRRSCVDHGAALDSLVFGSNLKNLHRNGEYKERIKNCEMSFQTMFDRPDGRPTYTRVEINRCPVDRCCTKRRKSSWQSTDPTLWDQQRVETWIPVDHEIDWPNSVINRELGGLRGRSQLKRLTDRSTNMRIWAGFWTRPAAIWGVFFSL